MLYRLTYDVYNSWRPEFPSIRVTVEADGYSPRDAQNRVRSIYVSRDGKTANLTGGVGADGYYYSEWEFVRARKASASA